MILRKQAIGIDISKDTLSACLGSRGQNGEQRFTASRSFKNTKAGYNRLLRWLTPMRDKQTKLVFLMEDKGLYYQHLAHHLHGVGKTVHVVLSNTSTHYAKSLNVKTKTDALGAKILAQFALKRTHRVWIPPGKILNELRNLTRYCVQLQEQRTTLNNMVHSKVSAHAVPSFIVSSNKQLVRGSSERASR